MIASLFSEGGWTLLLIQFTGCIVLGLGISFFYRQGAARAHQILLVSLGASVLLPALYVCVNALGLGLWAPPADSSSERLADVPTLAATQAPELSPLVGAGDALMLVFPESATGLSDRGLDTPKGASAAWFPSGRVILYLCWAMATMALLGRLVLQFVLGRRLLHQSERVTTSPLLSALASAKLKMAITGPVDMRTSSKVQSPVIWCWQRRPILLVATKGERSASTCDWESVFCHELAHWKRLDHIQGLAAEVLATLLPWHPLVWWARHRLLHFSELACDDWVLAAGQSGTEYAESLLNLTAQKQMLFLPAIMGKEHTMKERISRIVKGQVGNPSVNRRWTGFIVALGLCMSVGIAFAQTRPHPSHPDQDRVKRHEADVEEAARRGRRNVLHRLLDQLHEQLRETQAALRSAGDEKAERHHVLRFEVETLRQQIAHFEDQATQLELRRRDLHMEEDPLREHLEEIALHADGLRHERSTRDDSYAEEAHEIQHALKKIHEGMIVHEQRLERQHQDGPEGRAQLEDARQELRARHDRVRRRMGELESDLNPFRERDDRVRDRELRDRMRDLRSQEYQLDDAERDIDFRLELDDENQGRLHDNMKETAQQLHRLEELSRGESDEAHEPGKALSLFAKILFTQESRRAEELKIRNLAQVPATPMETIVLKLKYADPMQLSLILKHLIADPRGRVMADPRTRSVIITDAPENTERFLALVEQLDVPDDGSMTSMKPEEFSGYDTFLVPGRESRAAPGSDSDVDNLRDRVGDLSRQMQEMRALLEQLAKERPTADDRLGPESPPLDESRLQESLVF